MSSVESATKEGSRSEAELEQSGKKTSGIHNNAAKLS